MVVLGLPPEDHYMRFSYTQISINLGNTGIDTTLHP